MAKTYDIFLLQALLIHPPELTKTWWDPGLHTVITLRGLLKHLV